MSSLVPDRLPPNSEEAEISVLGCCMLDPVQCMAICVDQGVTASTFYHPKNGVIWDAMLALSDSGTAVDVTTLHEALKGDKRYKAIGGITYIMSLADAVPSPANLPFYLKIVFDRQIRRLLIRCGRDIEQMAWDTTIEAADIADKAESMVMAVDRSDSNTELEPIKEIIRRSISTAETAFKNDGAPRGLQTGIQRLDKAIPTGLIGGDLFYIAGRPSLGKTSLAMQMALNQAFNDHPVGVFSLEMGRDALINRAIANVSQVRMDTILQGSFNEGSMRAFALATSKIAKLPLYIDDRAGINVSQLRSRARRMVLRHGVKIIYLDYLQLLGGHKHGMEEYERISDLSPAIKILARELDIPFVVLLQLNREIDKDKPRRPRLSDLKGSGQLEADGDLIAALWNDQPLPVGENQDFVSTVLSLLKQRNGPLDDIPMVFRKPVMRHEIRHIE